MEIGVTKKIRDKSKVAIIPARGGSKRIPHKNIVDLAGKPLIAYTIEAALKTGIFEEVIVSTDDEKIAGVAESFGAHIPFLRDKYADDHANISQVIAYVLDRLDSDFGKRYDTVFQLMPNCPLRNEGDILAASEHFEKSGANFQISAFPFGWMNPWWAFTLDDKEKPQMVFEDFINKRSQDLPKLYCPTGAIWIADTQELRRTQNFYTEGYKTYILNWKSAMDIDDYEDLEMAKMLISLQHA